MTHKKYFLGLASLMILAFTGCKKETTEKVSTTLKVPTIELLGDEFISQAPGGSYTDLGAKYTGEDGSETTIQPSVNEVDPSTPGIYFIEYEETSTSGIFHTVAHRVVAIAYQDDPTDYSGTYLRTATGINAFVTRIAPGLYKVQNPGGSAGHEAVTVYFVETALNTFEGPLQPNDLVGDIEVNSISFSDTGGSWALVNPLYGPAVRVFVKQ